MPLKIPGEGLKPFFKRMKFDQNDRFGFQPGLKLRGHWLYEDPIFKKA